MGSYKNVKTGKVVEMDDDFFEGIKAQGNYVKHDKKPAAKRAAPKKKAKK